MESTVSVHGLVGDPDVDSPTLSVAEAVFVLFNICVKLYINLFGFCFLLKEIIS